jgi:hypothetical protein
VARRRGEGGGEVPRITRGPRNYHELGKLGGEARKRQLMGGRREAED